jgi:hypothetical protein
LSSRRVISSAVITTCCVIAKRISTLLKYLS